MNVDTIALEPGNSRSGRHVRVTAHGKRERTRFGRRSASMKAAPTGQQLEQGQPGDHDDRNRPMSSTLACRTTCAPAAHRVSPSCGASRDPAVACAETGRVTEAGTTSTTVSALGHLEPLLQRVRQGATGRGVESPPTSTARAATRAAFDDIDSAWAGEHELDRNRPHQDDQREQGHELTTEACAGNRSGAPSGSGSLGHEPTIAPAARRWSSLQRRRREHRVQDPCRQARGRVASGVDWTGNDRSPVHLRRGRRRHRRAIHVLRERGLADRLAAVGACDVGDLQLLPPTGGAATRAC